MFDEVAEVIEDVLSEYDILLRFAELRLSREYDEEIDEEFREQFFNSVSRTIAGILQIEPLEYTTKRADNFYREMADHIKTSLLKRKYKRVEGNFLTNRTITRKTEKES